MCCVVGADESAALNELDLIDRSVINIGMSRPTWQFQESKFGDPGAGCREFPKCRGCACSSSNACITNKLTNGKQSVGPFRIQANQHFFDVLTTVFQEVLQANPVLYHSLGTQGGFCCRPTVNHGVFGAHFSNHAWGCAVDIEINGVIDPRYDRKAQRGLHQLAVFMNAHRIYWAAGYSAAYEDAMHFEPARELIEEWYPGSRGGRQDC
jgi:hypothetical protein